MSFNRLKYDNCEIKKYNQETTSAGSYYYDAPLICNNCLNDNPRIINQKTGVSMNSHVDWRFYSGPVDVESELLNLNRASSRCPTNQYIPKCDPNDCTTGEPCGAGVSERCNNTRNSWNRVGDNNLVNFPNCFFPTEDTRLSNPCTNLRGTGWNRFDFLCKDPQEQVTFPGQYMTPTRLVVKDNHRPSVVNPQVNDMNPNGGDLPCHKISKDVCANFVGPLYQYDVCG
jgi:hypothetical protein